MRSWTIGILLVCVLGAGVWWWAAGSSVVLPDGAADGVAAGAPGAGVAADEGAGRTELRGDAAASAAPAANERVEAGAALRGRLTQEGRPLADVELVLFSGHAWQAVELARTTTNRDGAFSFALQPVACRLTSSDPRVPLPWTARVGLRSKGHDLGEISVPVPGTIAGRVVDPFGNGVAGAEVTRLLSQYEHVRFGGKGEQPKATTDADGRFRFARAKPEDFAQLQCVSDRFAIEAGHSIDVKAGAETVTKIELRAGHLLRGIVVDWQGQPLAGAHVWTEYGREATSDALGQFVIEQFRRGADVHAKAAGHIDAEQPNVFKAQELVRLQLRRAVRLRGVVRGTKGQPGVVRLDTGFNGRSDSEDHAPFSLMYKDLEILRDGAFVLEGLSCSDWDLTVRVPGVGAVGPVRVELRDDAELELDLVAEQAVTVVVRDGNGEAVAGEVLVDDGPRRYEYSYKDADRRLAEIRRSKERREPVALVDGEMQFGRVPKQRIAFAVSAPGYATETRLLEVDDDSDRVDVTMLQTGEVRGVVRGGRRGDYGASVRFWPVGHEPGDKAGFAVTVAADGTFARSKVPPGAYHAAVSRYGSMRPDQEKVTVPMFDNGVDLRAVVDCTVVAGEVAHVELDEPKLGVLRGRVVLRGRPVAGVAVVAERPGKKDDAPRSGLFGSGDWDDTLRIRHTSGMRTDANGAFVMLYRDAGPVELRARHPDADATSAPLRVELPPPGDDVVRELSLPVGEIRGVFPVDVVPEKQRDGYEVGLFPIHKAAHDPYHDPGDWAVSIADDCARVQAPDGGRFAFTFLPPGAYVVRVKDDGWPERMLWQRIVEVHEDVADLGPIEVRPRVSGDLRWAWRKGSKPVGQVGGFWIYRAHGGDASAVWAATVSATNGKAKVELRPGRYQAVPFIRWQSTGLSLSLAGTQNGEAAVFEMRSDGSVVPEVLTLSPHKPAAAEQDGR